ncbi:hypothetical protein B0H19DRAFT_1060736 [Mycena capillaripes]|nr:hypothetical protein B0H19DRAFT_1060736 [Mycena capillaripes]
MVAVNPRFTLLAFSLASLSLTPSADAAAINARSSSSDPGSPSKAARQQQQLPMPMKRMVTGKNVRADDVSRRSKDLKSRVAEANTPLREAFLKSQQQQTHFHVPRKHVEAREDAAGTPGHVDIVSSTTNSTEGHLLYNATTYTLDASPNNETTLIMVRSDSNHCTLQMPIVNTTTNATEAYCGTYDPAPMTPQPLRMEHCVNGSTPHSSQVFSCDSSTGVIAPIWSSGGDRNATSANNPSTGSTRTIDSRDTPQNVTLVFVPNSKNDVAAQEVESDPDSASATTTVTTTVTATATPSFAVADFDAASSSLTASSSQSTSDLFLSSTSSSPSPSFAAADFDPVSSTMDAVSSQPTFSSSPTGSSVAPASSSDTSRVGALAVEVAPAPSSPTESVSAVPSSASSVPSASASDSNASSATVDTAAVASDIVASNASSSGSASATASASSSASAADVAPSVVPAPSDEQAVYVAKAVRGAGTAQWRRE